MVRRSGIENEAISPPVHALRAGIGYANGHSNNAYEYIKLEVSGTNNRLAFEEDDRVYVHYQRVKKNMSSSLVHGFKICRVGGSC